MKHMDIAALIVVTAIAFCVGLTIGFAAEKQYFTTHCSRLGRVVVDDIAYECRKLYDSTVDPN
jgi:hypothetical protein